MKNTVYFSTHTAVASCAQQFSTNKSCTQQFSTNKRCTQQFSTNKSCTQQHECPSTTASVYVSLTHTIWLLFAYQQSCTLFINFIPTGLPSSFSKCRPSTQEPVPLMGPSNIKGPHLDPHGLRRVLSPSPCPRHHGLSIGHAQEVRVSKSRAAHRPLHLTVLQHSLDTLCYCRLVRGPQV
jgi:hypothetical protein